MSTFYWGYAITQVVGGQLADSHGGEVVLWIFGVVWSVSVLSFTVAANISNGLMAFANFVSGLSQGEDQHGDLLSYGMSFGRG